MVQFPAYCLNQIMNENGSFGAGGKREAAQNVDGFYLLGRYFIRAGLQGDLAHVALVLKDNNKDEKTLDRMLGEIKEKVNTASSSRLGDRITIDDVTKYIRESVERD